MTDLPRGWARTLLGDIVENLDHRRVPVNKEERAKRPGSVPYYGATGPVGWIDESLFDEELVLLGEDGAPFLDHGKPKAYLVSGPSWVNNHAHVLRTRGGLLSRYLLHYLNHFNYRGYANGTTRLKLTQASMNAIPIPLPPLAEQERMVAAIEEEFSRIDAGMSALERVRSGLVRITETVLIKAVEGKLVGQDPSDEPAAASLARVKRFGKLWRASAAAGMPALPNGWIWTTLAATAGRVTVGHVGPMKDEYVPDGIPFVRSQNVRPNRFDWKGLRHIQPAFHRRLEKSRIQPGDILVVRSGTVGTACVVPDSLGEANCSDVVIIQRPQAIVPEFAAYYLNSAARNLVRAGQVGVALIHFNTESVANLPVPLPPVAEQRRIVAETDRLLSVVAKIQRSVDDVAGRAASLRPAVLAAAFAGRIVSQDPTDEPAVALLRRIGVSGSASDGHRTVRRGRRSMPTPG